MISKRRIEATSYLELAARKVGVRSDCCAGYQGQGRTELLGIRPVSHQDDSTGFCCKPFCFPHLFTEAYAVRSPVAASEINEEVFTLLFGECRGFVEVLDPAFASESCGASEHDEGRS